MVPTIWNVTVTPATPLPEPSVTSTAGGTATFVKTVADWLLPALMAMVVGVPADTVKDVDIADVRPLPENTSVRWPGVPETCRFEKVATPLEFVEAVSVPPSVPAPLLILAVMLMPGVFTRLPATSVSCTAGDGGPNVAPLATGDGG